jgi:hypothetical protein
VTLPVWTNSPKTPLSTTQIENEFGGTAPTNLSEYYRNGSAGYVTGDRSGFPNGVETPIPVFGNPLSISNFYGASAVSYSITTNKAVYNEGETMTINITAPAANGSTLYWTIDDVTTTISISPLSLPSGIKGGSQNEVFQQQLTASGGTAPYTFSVVVGSPPAGITLSSSGMLSGAPTSAGVKTFTVQAIDSQGNGGIREYSLSVANVTYSPINLPNGTQGSAYSQQLSVSGGTAPYVYQMLGTLPSGLSLSSSGLISGTPTTTGTFNTSIRAIFNNGSMGDPGITISYQNWTIVSAPAGVTITVSPGSLPTGTINTSYSQQLTASGGTAPYTFSTSSSLPNGVTLSSSGLLSGTPTQSGGYNLAIQVSDSASHSNTVNYTLNIGSVSISISPSSLPSATQNSAFSQQLSASGGTSPYTYSATGSLPAGISLTQNGLLSGTPTVSGTVSVSVVATDANNNTGSKTYSLVIGAAAEAAPTLHVQVSRGDGSPSDQYVYESLSSSPGTAGYISIQIYNEYPVGHVFNPGDYDRVNWAITGDVSLSEDFGQMLVYSGATTDNDVKTYSYPSGTGTIDLKYFPGGNGRWMLGVIYIYVVDDGQTEGTETFTFTVTFGNQTASGSIGVRDYL